MSDPILTHEQKVEKLLSGILVSNNMIVALLTESPSVSDYSGNKAIETAEALTEMASELIDTI